MDRDIRRYKAILVSHRSIDELMTRLSSDPLFVVRVTEGHDSSGWEVTGPTIAPSDESLDQLRGVIGQRANELGLDVPDDVMRTARDLHVAQFAERLVLAAPLRVDVTRSRDSGESVAVITLEVAKEGGRTVQQCCEHFAVWRILAVASAMDMDIRELTVE